MKNKGFYIKSIIAKGDGVVLSRIDLQFGCNLIFGPSDTGKSTVFQILDFMFGSNSDPKKVPEGEGYDEYYMEIVTLHNNTLYTVKRKLNEKNVLVKECPYEQFDTIAIVGIPYSLTGNKNSYSSFLMGINGHKEGLEIRKNVAAKMKLTFTWLRHLVLTDESNMVSETPIFNPSGNVIYVTPEKSLIYYLTTGVDDSELAAEENEKIRVSRIKGKIEITLEDITSVESRISDFGDIGYAEFTESAVQTIQNELNCKENQYEMLQKKLNSRNEEKRNLYSSKLFAEEFISRMKLLQKHYLTDKKRYEYLSQGAALFEVADEIKKCPLCNSKIEEPAQVNVNYRNAISQEVIKVDSKLRDIANLINGKEIERLSIVKKIEMTEKVICEIRYSINSFGGNLEFLKQMLQQYQENIEKKTEKKLLLEELDRLNMKWNQLKKEQKEKSANSSYKRTTDIRDEFCEMLKNKLLNWNVIKKDDRILFDEKNFDFTIGNKQRIACGKGTRGVTRTAILITLLEYCNIKDIPFSSLLVMDSPITAHFSDGRKEADDMTQSRFFKYCNNNVKDYQLIIIDNKSPNAEDREKLNNINYIEFSKEEGRNGFYMGKI